MLAGTDSLVLLRGQWVEIDRERLERSIRQFRDAEELAAREGLTFAEAMRMLAGAAVADDAGDVAVADWSRVTAGPWLAETLQRLRSPDGGAMPIPDLALHGTLRPYQRAGVQWLRSAVRAGAWRLPGRRHGAGQDDPGAGAAAGGAVGGQPSLLVAPASLLANWAAEIEKFAPDLKAAIVHPSAMTRGGRSRSSPPNALRNSIWRSPATARCCASGAGGDRMALCDPGRGAGDQEPERQADPRGQGAEGDGAHRADRHAGRESPGRSVVDLRFHQSRPAGIGQAVQPLRQEAGRAREQSIWPAARAGAALHPAPDEDRQVDHRRPAGQDRGEGVVRSQPQAGGAV